MFAAGLSASAPTNPHPTSPGPSMTPAGAQSSSQCETAVVYELQSQVVGDAPQEVSSSSGNN